MRIPALTIVALATLCATARTQEAPKAEAVTSNTIRLAADAARPKAAIDAMAWLAGGTWRGDGLGGVTEESWSTPAAGAMMGMFRLLKPAADSRQQIGFYEFLTFVEQNNTLALKLKHFNADLTGWEEKDGFVTFRLARVADDAIYFDGLTFRREGANKMTVFLALRDRDTGTVSEATFRYTRQ